ncbi:MAG: bifunctional folylpolyglutamate synthase/dihydrofolate synthase [Chloroflexota bacterium]
MNPPPSPDAAAIAALAARGRFGIRLGLGRTRALLAALGDPQDALRGALIGGTNGKGSTQAIVASILGAAGVRTGQTPKPHLVAYRERIVVDGAPIAADAFAALLDEVLGVADRVARRHGPPTEFEALTAAAFLHLARARVAVAVIEVGLGGRLDATNTWDGGVAAIVNVGLDHMEHLGPTVEAIAREKAAIVKRGDRAVTGATGPALAIVRRRAARVGAPLTLTPPLPVLGHGRDGLRLDHPRLGPVALGLLGRHQAANAAVALGIVDALAAAGIADVDDAAIRTGLAGARWPGRLELRAFRADGRTADGPPDGHGELLLDGAHNADGAAALAAAFAELRPVLAPGRPLLLLGVMADKEVGAMLDALRSAPALAGARVVTVTVPDAPRALPADALAAAWGPGAEAAADLPDALGRLVAHARAEDAPAIVAGSLYLVGAVRGALVPAADG